MATTNGTPAKGRVRQGAHVCARAHTHVHQHIQLDATYTEGTQSRVRSELSEGLPPLNLASLIRRATTEGLPTPLSEPFM